jgi:hypothetical protein
VVNLTGLPEVRLRSCLTAVVRIVVVSLVVMSSADAVAGQTTPNLSGTWHLVEHWKNVPTTSPYYVQDATYTFTRTAPNTYSINNGAGWTTTNVPISGDSFTEWTCGNGGTYSQTNEAACPATSGYWLNRWRLTFKAGSPDKATGTFDSYLPGQPAGSYGYGTFTATGPPQRCGGASAAAMHVSTPGPTATIAGCSQKVVLSGAVMQRLCFVRNGKFCTFEEVPIHEAGVRAVGPRGTYTTKTDGKGRYSFKLRRGRYTVTLARYSTDINDPAEHVVNLKSDQSGVNFVRCDRSRSTTQTATNCRLVEVDGRAEDIDGAPIGPVTVTGEGGIALSDASGNFVVWVDHQPQNIDGELTARTPPQRGQWWPQRSPPSGFVHVDATHRVANVVLTIHPALWLATNAALDNASEMVEVAGLPLHQLYGLGGEPAQGTSCSRVYDGVTGSGRVYPFAWEPDSPFCPVTQVGGYKVRLFLQIDHKSVIPEDGHGLPVVGYFNP